MKSQDIYPEARTTTLRLDLSKLKNVILNRGKRFTYY